MKDLSTDESDASNGGFQDGSRYRVGLGMAGLGR